jgi:hypothetical protein
MSTLIYKRNVLCYYSPVQRAQIIPKVKRTINGLPIIISHVQAVGKLDFFIIRPQETLCDCPRYPGGRGLRKCKEQDGDLRVSSRYQ